MMLQFQIKDAVKTRVMIGELGKSISQFADEIGISQAYLSQILNGKRNPSPVVASKISKGLDKEINNIFFIHFDNKGYQNEGDTCKNKKL